MTVAQQASSNYWISKFFFGALIAGMLYYSYTAGADFHVFYLAGERFYQGISEYQLADGWMPFKYHPLWTMIFSIWTIFPEKIALLIFNILHLFCWFKAVSMWASAIGINLTDWRSRLLLLLLSLSAFSADIGYGQLNGFIFLCMTYIFKNLESAKQKPLLAGFLFSLLVSLKLNFALLGVYILIKNRKSILGMILGLLAIHLTLAITYQDLFCIDKYTQWLSVLLDQSSNQFAYADSQGFLRFFLSLSMEYGKTLWAFALMIFVGFGFFVYLKKPSRTSLMPMYWLAGVYLFSPLAWWYLILFLFPLAFYLLNSKILKLERVLILIALFAIMLCNYNTLGPDGMTLFKESMGYFFCSMVFFILFIKYLLFNNHTKDLIWNNKNQTHEQLPPLKNLLFKFT